MHSAHGRDILQAQTALLVAIAISLSLPENLAVGSRYLIAGLCVVLMFGILLATPFKHSLGARVRRDFAVALIALISFVNIFSMISIVDSLLYGGLGGKEVIFSAFAIFVNNIIIFSIWYWEIDRPALTGVHWRDKSPNFLFPQEMPNKSTPVNWKPSYLDYLYISVTNSTAFSPTDAMPLTHEAKALMGVQAIVALLTVVLVTARAVTTLG